MLNKDIVNRFKSLETPFYYYDLDLLTETVKAAYKPANSRGYEIHYAIKANVNEPVLKIIQKQGLGADCVSGPEVEHALKLGFKPEKIVFAGVGKTDKEIIFGLEQGISCFNVESIAELRVINELAQKLGKTAKIALRLNPNVDAKTHHYITTGLSENKFGINYTEIPEIIENLPKFKNIEFIGLHFHIGSQITQLESFKNLCLRVNDILNTFKGYGIELQTLNLGGGLGVDYENPDGNPIPDFESFFEVFEKFLIVDSGVKIQFELGRSLVGQCAALITRVIYVKQAIKTHFAIVDAGMNDLMRPALYQAYHKIENLSSTKDLKTYDVVGPVCESSDSFGRHVQLPRTDRGDLIAIRTTGAYGQVMGNSYNLRPSTPSVYGPNI